MANQAKCGSCGAAIRWVIMPGGAKMPVDANPSSAGNIALHSDGVRAVVLKADEMPLAAGKPLYVSHFASCPNSAQHRKPKPPKKWAPSKGGAA